MSIVGGRPVMLVVMSQKLMTQRAFLLLATIVVAWLCADASASDRADITELVYDLESDDPAQQAEAAEMLARIVADVNDAVPQLKDLLTSTNTRTRLAAVRALWAIQGVSKTHLTVIVPGLTDEDVYNRQAAAELLGQLGPQAPSTVPMLTKLLTDENADVRISAADALGEIGPTAKSAIPNLVAALEDRGKASWGPMGFPLNTVGAAAGLALRRIGPDAIPAIAPLLKHDDKEVRLRAMWVLVGGGETSRPYIPVVLKSLRDDDVTVRQAAAEILGALRIAPRESVPELAKLLKDKDRNVRFWSATSLGRYGPQAETVLTELIAALQDEHPGVRARAADALGAIGPAAKEALPHLQHLREDRDFFFYPHASIEHVSSHAVKAIDKIQNAKNPKGNGE